MYAFLGTRRAFNDDGRDDKGNPVPAGDRAVAKGKSRVEIIFPDGHTVGAAFADVTASGGVWTAQSPDEKPAWVASDSSGLAALLGEHYGVPVREPVPEGERGEHAARYPSTTTREG